MQLTPCYGYIELGVCSLHEQILWSILVLFIHLNEFHRLGLDVSEQAEFKSMRMHKVCNCSPSSTCILRPVC